MPTDIDLTHSPLVKFCRSLPYATSDIKWGDNLIFSIGGKIFAGFDTSASGYYSFKCTEQTFLRLIQKPGIVPAPYSARFFWVQVRRPRALTLPQARQLLREAYGIILAGLPKRTQTRLRASP
ncbi:MAG: MmcQ/YjbR family DNA-binding protein [Phycisphaerales bacterium]